MRWKIWPEKLNSWVDAVAVCDIEILCYKHYHKMCVSLPDFFFYHNALPLPASISHQAACSSLQEFISHNALPLPASSLLRLARRNAVQRNVAHLDVCYHDDNKYILKMIIKRAVFTSHLTVIITLYPPNIMDRISSEGFYITLPSNPSLNENKSLYFKVDLICKGIVRSLYARSLTHTAGIIYLPSTINTNGELKLF